MATTKVRKQNGTNGRVKTSTIATTHNGPVLQVPNRCVATGGSNISYPLPTPYLCWFKIDEIIKKASKSAT